ncbi:MAG: YbaB/EbfC family nucleoid-associated protein [Planctomycetota bacterium]
MKGMGNMGNMGGLMKQAQKMQQEMARIQDDLAERIVEGSAGGGMVKAMVNGKQELVAIKIDPETVDPEDVEMLEDLVTAAVSAGMKKAKELAEKEMSKVTGGLNLPGLF